VRPVRFLYLCIKVFVYLLTQFTIFFDKKVGTNQKKRCTIKNNRKSYFFSFLQCALSYFFIFRLNVVFYLFTQFKMFFSFKGTYQRKRCTFKNNLKSHIFIFTVRPVRFLYLYIKVCFLPTNTVYSVFYF